jgi:hypothetical protein
LSVPDLDADTIAAAAMKPASASQDGRAATAVSIPDQIKALEKLEAQASVSGTNQNGGHRSGWAGLRPARVVPPGAV